jgi:hypothetical protein
MIPKQPTQKMNTPRTDNEVILIENALNREGTYGGWHGAFQKLRNHAEKLEIENATLLNGLDNSNGERRGEENNITSDTVEADKDMALNSVRYILEDLNNDEGFYDINSITGVPEGVIAEAFNNLFPKG